MDGTFSLDRLMDVRHRKTSAVSESTNLATRIIDTSENALAELLVLALSLANKLSESDVFIRHDLTAWEWALLTEFPADGSEIIPRKVGALAGLSRQRVKVLVAKLESKGMVQPSVTAEAAKSKAYVIASAGASFKSDVEKTISDMQVAVLNPSQTRVLARSVRVVRRLLKATSKTKSAP